MPGYTHDPTRAPHLKYNPNHADTGCPGVNAGIAKKDAQPVVKYEYKNEFVNLV